MFEKWRKKRKKNNMKKQAAVLSKLCDAEDPDLDAIIMESDKMIQMLSSR